MDKQWTDRTNKLPVRLAQSKILRTLLRDSQFLPCTGLNEVCLRFPFGSAKNGIRRVVLKKLEGEIYFCSIVDARNYGCAVGALFSKICAARHYEKINCPNVDDVYLDFNGLAELLDDVFTFHLQALKTNDAEAPAFSTVVGQCFGGRNDMINRQIIHLSDLISAHAVQQMDLDKRV